MANAQRGEAAITVDGTEYTLRPTFDALCELETLVNKPFADILNTVTEGRLSGLRSVAWCLLQDRHGAQIKTLKDASEWIEEAGGADVVLEAVYRCFSLNMDSAIEQSAADPQNAQVGTSAGSSSAPVESA